MEGMGKKVPARRRRASTTYELGPRAGAVESPPARGLRADRTLRGHLRVRNEYFGDYITVAIFLLAGALIVGGGIITAHTTLTLPIDIE